jgi:hypothetical protein
MVCFLVILVNEFFYLNNLCFENCLQVPILSENNVADRGKKGSCQD